MELRIGQGFDLHRFEVCELSSPKIILGGVEIPLQMPKKIVAHSDGDLLTHSIIDALLGASSLNTDIGQLFPETDPDYYQVSSLFLLKKVFALLKEQSWEIVNLDNTLICQEPRLAKFRTKILEKLSSVLEISPEKIGLKAKTSEKIGALGRKEGIACFSVVLLSKASQKI